MSIQISENGGDYTTHFWDVKLYTVNQSLISGHLSVSKDS